MFKKLEFKDCSKGIKICFPIQDMPLDYVIFHDYSKGDYYCTWGNGHKNHVFLEDATYDECEQACQSHFEGVLREGLDLTEIIDSIENIEPLDGYSDQLKTLLIEKLEASND